MARRRRYKAPPAYVGGGGGVGIKKPSPKPSTGGLTQPPFLTYDPGLEAQRRAAQRGLHDTLQDTRRERHFANRDLAQSLRDIKAETQRSRGKINRAASRSREGINTESGRGLRSLADRESAAKLSASRSQEDFSTQLKNIGRKFATLGQSQREGANAAGILDAGTLAASKAARAKNQTIAEEPIHTAQQRVEQDLATALREIGVARGDLSKDTETQLRQLFEDQERGVGQLAQDRNRNRRLTKQQAARKKKLLGVKAQRARREAAIANIDLTAQEIYQARANRPGAFSKRGGKRKKRGGKRKKRRR